LDFRNNRALDGRRILGRSSPPHHERTEAERHLRTIRAAAGIARSSLRPDRAPGAHPPRSSARPAAAVPPAHARSGEDSRRTAPPETAPPFATDETHAGFAVRRSSAGARPVGALTPYLLCDRMILKPKTKPVEELKFYRCPACGQMVDNRDRDAIRFHHDHVLHPRHDLSFTIVGKGAPTQNISRSGP
jgi:hypothetical protein